MKANSFPYISKSAQKRALFVLGISAVILLYVLNTLDKPLKTASAPMGIVSYELAGDYSHSQAILSSWNDETKIYAALSLGIDYLFLVVYSLFFAFGCYKIAEKFNGKTELLARIGYFLSGGQLFAGLFDSIENYSLIKLLLGSGNELFSSAAFYCASIKFFLIMLGIIYIVLGLLILKFYSSNPQKEDS